MRLVLALKFLMEAQMQPLWGRREFTAENYCKGVSMEEQVFDLGTFQGLQVQGAEWGVKDV